MDYLTLVRQLLSPPAATGGGGASNPFPPLPQGPPWASPYPADWMSPPGVRWPGGGAGAGGDLFGLARQAAGLADQYPDAFGGLDRAAPFAAQMREFAALEPQGLQPGPLPQWLGTTPLGAWWQELGR